MTKLTRSNWAPFSLNHASKRSNLSSDCLSVVPLPLPFCLYIPRPLLQQNGNNCFLEQRNDEMLPLCNFRLQCPGSLRYHGYWTRLTSGLHYLTFVSVGFWITRALADANVASVIFWSYYGPTGSGRSPREQVFKHLLLCSARDVAIV
jgi:hypothetical protein